MSFQPTTPAWSAQSRPDSGTGEIAPGLRNTVRVLHQHAVTVLTVLLLVIALASAISPVRYAVMRPGQTMNTLGQDPGSKKELITVEGRESYPTTGQLRFTTVGVVGKPERLPVISQAAWAWLSSTQAVVPIELIYPPTKSTTEVDTQNRSMMTTSQEVAKQAARQALNLPLQAVRVTEVKDGQPAKGKLEANDAILAVDGKPVASSAEVVAAIAERNPGDTVKFTVRRGNDPKAKPQQIAVVAGSAAPDSASLATRQRPQVGIGVTDDYGFTINVNLSEDIGGPSAGLMLTLAIVDKLTPGPLTNGAVVAGTGTMENPDGLVGPIGGIEQKVHAAKRDGATIFLTPVENCAAAAENTPDGLRLVKVRTLADALAALEALKNGQPVTECSTNDKTTE